MTSVGKNILSSVIKEDIYNLIFLYKKNIEIFDRIDYMNIYIINSHIL